MYYRDQNTSGHPEHLDDDDKDLSYYGVQSGGEILMEESISSQKGEQGGDEEDEQKKAAREQIETMEAIRLAQREEVEAAKGAVSSAAGERKVNAADAVPFVSKIR